MNRPEPAPQRPDRPEDFSEAERIVTERLKREEPKLTVPEMKRAILDRKPIP